jgi:hypothetical protein
MPEPAPCATSEMSGTSKSAKREKANASGRTRPRFDENVTVSSKDEIVERKFPETF